MTPDERKLGIERVRAWPREALDEAAKLTKPEQELLVEAAALLDVWPCESPEPGPRIIEIP